MIYGKIAHKEVITIAKNLLKSHGYDCLHPILANIIGCSVVITSQEKANAWIDDIRTETVEKMK